MSATVRTQGRTYQVTYDPERNISEVWEMIGGGGNGTVRVTARGRDTVSLRVKCLPGSFYWSVPEPRVLRRIAAIHAERNGRRLTGRRTERTDGPVETWWFFYETKTR